MSNIVALRKNENKEKDNNKNLYNYLFKNNANYSIVSSSPKAFTAIHKDDIGENFYLSEPEMDAYLDGFYDVLSDTKLMDSVIDKEDEENLLNETAIDDLDIKLSLYRSFRSLYDKWISKSKEGETGYFFNTYGDENNSKSLIDHFKFINRVGTNIGHEAVVDVAQITDIGNAQNGEGPTESLYQVMTGLLAKNNFDFWPSPSNIDLTTSSLSDDNLKDFFRASTDKIDNLKQGPIFNCVYVGGSSRTIKDVNNKEHDCGLINVNTEYDDDSFDLMDSTATDWPEDFKKTDQGKGIMVFRVRYGQESQNHFQSLQLEQEGFKETQESLMIIDALTNPEKGNSPSRAGKGNNMYDIYLTRAYNCIVSGLGNMSIQPLMYFKLENVPMFRGTYLINGIRHEITPNNIKTDFTGLRQPRITLPLVTEPISLLDLALSENAENAEERKREGSSSSSPTLSDFGVGSEVINLPYGSSNGGNPRRLGDYNN